MHELDERTGRVWGRFVVLALLIALLDSFFLQLLLLDFQLGKHFAGQQRRLRLPEPRVPESGVEVPPPAFAGLITFVAETRLVLFRYQFLHLGLVQEEMKRLPEQPRDVERARPRMLHELLGNVVHFEHPVRLSIFEHGFELGRQHSDEDGVVEHELEHEEKDHEDGARHPVREVSNIHVSVGLEVCAKDPPVLPILHAARWNIVLLRLASLARGAGLVSGFSREHGSCEGHQEEPPDEDEGGDVGHHGHDRAHQCSERFVDRVEVQQAEPTEEEAHAVHFLAVVEQFGVVCCGVGWVGPL
mmetsp:Transcript_16234/g.38619  ORF Transcript_16234/g.38619 Transcript_16234/m.38619 type:complete len:301 (-) Transcript_16234:911-1813(-)